MLENKIYHNHILYCPMRSLNQRINDCEGCEHLIEQLNDHTWCKYVMDKPKRKPLIKQLKKSKKEN
jgi:hypothetical protein